MSIENYHRKAQAPQTDIEQAHGVTTPSSLNDMPNQPPVYIEGAGTSQYGPGTAPNTRHREEIDPIDRNEKRGLSNKAKVIIGGLTLTSLIGAGIAGKNLMDGAAAINELKNGDSDRGISAPLVPGYAPETVAPIDYTPEALDSMSSDDFAKLDIDTRLNHLGGSLDEWRSDSLGIMQKYMDSEQSNLLNSALPQNKEQYSDQDILNSHAIDVFDASVQGDTYEDTEEGRKLLSTIIDPGHSNYSSLSRQIGNGKGGVLSIFKASEKDYPRITNQNFMSETIGSDGAEIIRNYNTQDGKEYLSLFELVKTSEGKESWVLKKSYNPNDPAVNTAISNISPQN